MTRLQVTLAASLLALATPALAAPPAAQAQPVQQPAGAGPKIGLGIALNSDPTFSSPAEILVPIILNPTIRVEPSLGIFSRNVDGGTDTRNFVLGVGVLAGKQVAPATELLFGGRLKLGFAKFDNGVTSDSGTDILIAGAAGAEHWFSDKFSLGLEAQLGYYALSNVSGDASGFFTQGALTARVYF
ncbi:MAG: hypothetical protein QM704_26940 [Anaeromyxobacteraceae bacterium]